MAKEIKSVKSEKHTGCMCGCSTRGSWLLIIAGLILGLGAGFAFNSVPAGLFIGFGLGLLFFAVIQMRKGCCD